MIYFILKYIILPLLQGEYRTSIDRVYPCESTVNHTFQFNVYTSKKTSSIAELKGNITFLQPFDDTVIVSIVY